MKEVAKKAKNRSSQKIPDIPYVSTCTHVSVSFNKDSFVLWHVIFTQNRW